MIFIVGNSRSGTTMLGRIFDLNSRVHAFEELHFFEQIVDAKDLAKDEEWPKANLLKLAERLITTSREGLFYEVEKGKYTDEAEELIDGLDRKSPLSLYKALLRSHTQEAGKQIPLEQTPRYLFMARDILEAFPDSHVINIVRDPRDVMQSQKDRWKRGRYATAAVPFLWTLRSWANYHPFTTSKIWASSVSTASKMESLARFHSISYEDLLADPENVLRDLCDAIDLPFEEEMLQVTQVGSSMGRDRPDQRGLDKSRIGSWKRGNLTKAEIAICEDVAGDQMRERGYAPSGITANPLAKFLQKASFPPKLVFAGLVNLNRFKNLPQLIARRLS